MTQKIFDVVFSFLGFLSKHLHIAKGLLQAISGLEPTLDLQSEQTASDFERVSRVSFELWVTDKNDEFVEIPKN